MKLCSRDYFCQLFHVGWFDVHDVETLVLDVEIPKVDSKIVAADESLSITIHRYAIDVVGMGI